ncbi:MAG: hypothetical protein C4520_09490 [Candidatus Abyssobacteria bacterium SURF_5]|uniref:Ferritin-like domain-containing protein n=1 Tax=Abyssobacteria bacterium (strain SURF_5) TaxID=2093360 RepID=A0A3A4P1D8_ABYX5|nr:MAG: hypothetical protein C4520_09490 [Candidatus Abyssubacteria bacterium SURF_5]
MAFNPLRERGIPLEKHLRNWSELNVKPYDKHSVHPYTRTRVILMNGIEVESAMFGHQFARHTADMELKRKLANVRRIEQQQQKAVNWLLPADESVLEITIGYEQVAVDLTAGLAKTERDPYVKKALDFALLEDFDHLYRYSNLLNMSQGKPAEEVTGKFTEITVGRPTIAEHRHPYDEVRKHYDAETADLLTQLHVMTIIAAEQQTMNFYMNVGNRPEEIVGRGLYLEIAQIEEQHVTHYESLMDPRSSWFEQLVLHEYNECFLYYSLMQHEEDRRIKSIWELHLNQEIEHLRSACDLMRQYEKREAEEMLPKEMPAPFKFESNLDYVRQVMADSTDFNALETDFVPADRIPKDSRYYHYQAIVNRNGVPSQMVIEQHIQHKGRDYRFELKGPHPVERFRSYETVTI